MILHTIKRITDLADNDRLDGRYPIRIGRRCKLILNGCGYPMLLEYHPRENEDYKGYLRTSIVEDIEAVNGITKIITQTSIYYFEELKADF
jgi:hypothetical protein